jgi:hypothetical protein
MAFPFTNLSSRLEILRAGTWTDITSRAQAPDGSMAGFLLTRGRQDEQESASRTTLTGVLDNTDYYFSHLSPFSTNYGVIDVNTPVRLSVDREGDSAPATITDTFTRTVPGGWGTSTSGHQWFALSTPNSNTLAVNGSAAEMLVNTATSSATAVLSGVRYSDVELLCNFSVSLPTGGNLEPTWVLRANGPSDYLMVRLYVSPAGALSFGLLNMAGGVDRGIASVSITDRTYTGGATWSVRVRIEANRVTARVWDSGGSEPTGWDLDVPECGRLGRGWVGVRSGVGAGVTSVPAQFTYDTFSATPIDGDYSRRWYGRLGRFAMSTDHTGRHLTVPLDGVGTLQQIAQGSKSLRSPMYRAFGASDNINTLIAYWPVEDTSGSTQIAAATVDTPPGEISDPNEITLAALSDIPGSEPIAVLGSSPLTFTVPAYTSTEHKIVSTFSNAGTPMADLAQMIRLYCVGGTVSYLNLHYGTGGLVQLQCTNTAGTTQATASLIISGLSHSSTYISIELTQDGADLDWRIYSQTADRDPIETGLYDGTFTGVTIGRIKTVVINWNGSATGGGFGQLAIGNETTAFLNVQTQNRAQSGLYGHDGERAAVRFLRLLGEEGYSGEVVGQAQYSEQMGPQSSTTLSALLSECEAVDRGVLYESRYGVGPAYRCRYSMYNQYPAVLIDYDEAHISEPFLPVYDDSLLHNDVTVQRTDGSATRRVMDEGPVSVSPPPDGVGVYDRGTIVVPAYEDSQTSSLAYWIRAIGTVHGYRFPQLGIHLSRTSWRSSAALSNAMSGMDVGDLTMLINLPAWLGAEDVPLLMHGYGERMTQREWEFTPVLRSGDPWETEIMDQGGTTTIVVAMDSDDTNMTVDVSAGPAWSTEAPYLVKLSTGEIVRVTSVVTSTITYVGEGTIHHNTNGSNTPTLPASIQDGDLLITHAAIRNSGTGTPNAPSGWEILVSNGNQALIGQYYASGTAPTVTYANGVANATTSAQVFAFRNASKKFGSGSLVTPAAATQLNSSAGNIAVPALTVLRGSSLIIDAAWKQDDWTSVAPPSGISEVQDDFSTLGDDQGVALGYAIQTTATNLSADSWTVTGGISAISRSIRAAFRPVQHMTVERAVNGVSASAPAGTTVTAWRLSNMSL